MTTTHDIDVDLIQHVGNDAMIAAAAKVSVSGQAAKAIPVDGISGLIRYLIRHRHGSPFEHGLMTFFVHAPIFVIREMQRHRAGVSHNEESGRYTQLQPVFWTPGPDRPIAKTPDYKSARPTFAAGTPEQFELIHKHDALYDALYDAYEAEIAAGVGNEVARRLLPLGTYSSCWITFNPRSLMHFLSLRTHRETVTRPSYPQAEIEDVANQMEALFAHYWPITHRWFDANGRVSP